MTKSLLAVKDGEISDNEANLEQLNDERMAQGLEAVPVAQIGGDGIKRFPLGTVSECLNALEKYGDDEEVRDAVRRKLWRLTGQGNANATEPEQAVSKLNEIADYLKGLSETENDAISRVLDDSIKYARFPWSFRDELSSAAGFLSVLAAYIEDEARPHFEPYRRIVAVEMTPGEHDPRFESYTKPQKLTLEVKDSNGLD